jgi:DNA-binding transcriptional LysR family regulator
MHYRYTGAGAEGLNPMLLQHLETFVRVAEEGNFTRAGELLNLSQPAVTRQIAALERELGAPLLERGRGLHLTAVGQTAYTHARHVLAEVGHLKADVASLSDPQSGEVSIACVTTVGLFTLPQLLNDYRAAYPRVRLRVWSARADGVIDRLLDGNSEIGLTSTPVAHPRLETTPLFEDPIIPVAAPSLAAQLPNPLPKEQLAQIDMALFQAPSRFRTHVDAELEQAGVYPRITMEFDSHEAVCTAAKLGYAIGMVPRQAVAADLDEGSLVELRVEGLPRIRRTTCLVLRRNETPLLPSAANFVRMLLERYKRPAGLRRASA